MNFKTKKNYVFNVLCSQFNVKKNTLLINFHNYIFLNVQINIEILIFNVFRFVKKENI